ncbi:hypothetical protein Vretimale_607 [Volvox reticuliferus]|uniref:Uncharacterized protein n=2 Tax=Volvox reticuliferus TaxID=1737510 RepID=A0A8J4C0A8_9CHLO|nr:hypothetical protein Vretifemale_2351 [Volvox reticuliferus]GIL94420.1 hypothetical protein Vretimale_607 [Volvox reticuliferus]
MDDRRTKRGMRPRAAERSEDEKIARPGTGPASGGGGIFKSAAVAVLRQHRKLMTTGDITRLAVDMGLLKCQGKTPEATMASALYTDVKRKLQKSLFTRPQEGLFGLREWLEEGYYPEGWVGPPDGLGLAPFKRRNNTGSHQGGASVTAVVPKVVRQGVRTGPGRSSKSRASRSWRTTSSDAEDDEMEDDDDDMMMGGRSYLGSSSLTVHGAGSAAGLGIVHGDDEDGEDAMGEGEDGDMEEEPDGGEEATADEGLEEQGSDRRPGNEDLGGGGGPWEEQHHVKDLNSTRGYPHQPAVSPGTGGGRRGGRFRSGGGGAASEPPLPQDECLSPLHMLGEAAASESIGELVAEQSGTPPAKRRRPSCITVPDRGGGVEGATPKSPYEDSLAALHEIATSPSTFDLTSHRESQQRDREAGRGGFHAGEGPSGGGGKVGRMRPRLHVDVPSHGPDLISGPGSRRDGGTPGTTLLTDNPMLQGETTPAILLQASPVTTANGQQAMMLRQAPVLVTLPPALASPSVATAGQLDTPALLHVQLPGGAPSELMQTTLITPTGQQLTPFRPHAGGNGQSGRGGLKVDTGPASSRPVGRRVSFSGQVGILGPPSGVGVSLHQALQPPGQVPAPSGAAANGSGQITATPGGQTWPPKLTPVQVEHEFKEITRVQTVVERLESKLGNTHPQVGKAWLSLSRMYQHLAEAQRNIGGCCMSSRAKSVEALKRARTVCRAVAESCGTSLLCEVAFDYLTARNNGPAGDIEPSREAAASPADCPGRADGESVLQPLDFNGSCGKGAATAQQHGLLGDAHAVIASGSNDASGAHVATGVQEQHHRQDTALGTAGPEGSTSVVDAGSSQPTVVVQG